MKKVLFALFLPLLLLPFASFNSDSLIGRPIPLIANKTLDGKTVNENYFKGHVTVVSFMFIGCLPCMNEIGIFNRIKNEYNTDPRFQALCIARQMKEQMIQFNADNKTMFSQIRKALHVDSIEYPIQPACCDAKSKMDSADSNVMLKSECSTITEKYGVEKFPTIFFVDKKGIIRKINTGGPATRNDSSFYNGLKKEINALLNE